MKSIFILKTSLALLFTGILSVGVTAPAHAQDGARTLEDLLELVQRGMVREDRLAKEREAKFIANKEAQVEAIASATDIRNQEKARAERLELEFQANKEKLKEKRQALKVAKGELEELFGHINSAAGDLRDTVEEGMTIDGFFTSLQQMQKGGKYEVFIPADQAYGAEPPPGAPIPPNADLIFEIELVDSEGNAEIVN